MPVVVSAAWEVRQALRSLGLSPEIVRNVAEAAAAGKAECLEIDPCSAPGTLAYFRGIRSLRMQLMPLGWRLSRTGNVESTVNDDLGIQVCFQNVDLACSERDPQAISTKGSGSRKLIRQGHTQGELFEHSGAVAPQVSSLGAVPTVWVVCVSTEGGRLCAEVSCPEAFEGNQFDGFRTRILVVNDTLESTPDVDRDRDAGDESDPYEVQVVRK